MSLQERRKRGIRFQVTGLLEQRGIELQDLSHRRWVPIVAGILWVARGALRR